MPEPVTVVSGFNDMAMMGEPVQKCRCQFRITEHTRPFREAQVGGNNYAGLLIQLADQVEQQCSSGLAERQIAQLIQNHQIGMRETIG